MAMHKSAHTFTPQNNSLSERMNAYYRVQQDMEFLRENGEKLDEDTLGDKECVDEAHRILSHGLKEAFESISESELQEAVEEGVYSHDELVAFIQSKQRLEMEMRRQAHQQKGNSRGFSQKR